MTIKKITRLSKKDLEAFPEASVFCPVCLSDDLLAMTAKRLVCCCCARSFKFPPKEKSQKQTYTILDSNVQKLSKIHNKSQLINQLLSKHFDDK
jgi:hypothetical protein